MKVLVGAFNQEKALVGAFSVLVQPVVEPMEHYTALASMLLGTVASTNEVSMFILAATLRKYLLMPPYMSSMETMWSPASRRWVMVVQEASPLGNTQACAAPSSEARQASSTPRVGLPLR